MIIVGAVTGKFNTWLTTVWLVGFGALIGLAILLVVWGILFAISRRLGRETHLAVIEGPLLPVLWLFAVFALVGVAGSFLIRDRDQIIQSLARLPSVGSRVYQLVLPAAPNAETDPESITVPIPFRGGELKRLEVESDESLVMTLPGDGPDELVAEWDVSGGEPFTWNRRAGTLNRLAGMKFDGIVLMNLGDADSQVKVKVVTEPFYPQVTAIILAALFVVGVFLVYMTKRWLLPKTSAIALAACKTEMVQPLFLLLTVIGGLLLLLFIYVPYYTFDEDIKMLKNSSLELIMVLCIFQAIWAASSSVSDEIEGRTALSVLSKPVGRPAFIFGKFFGIAWTELVMFLILSGIFLCVVAYKPIYDARETSEVDPTWMFCYREMARVVPGLILAFFEALVFAAISVALSTRLPMLANLIVCFAIYALGHLTPLMVMSDLNQFPIVTFVGELIATVLPMLNNFNIQAAVAMSTDVPWTYLLTAGGYCVLYCTIALLFGLILFQDRDLA